METFVSSPEGSVIVTSLDFLLKKWLMGTDPIPFTSNFSVCSLSKGVSIDSMPNEQTAIADFLDRKTAKIDELIKKKERLIELLKEKRQALISSAVTGKVRVDEN